MTACHDARPVSEHTGSWKGVIFGVGIAAFAAYQQFKLPVVLPVLLERYGYDRVLAGGFMSVYALTGLVLSVWLGGVIERRGAIGPVLIAMGLLAAGSALSLAFPASGMLMLAGRALEGCDVEKPFGQQAISVSFGFHEHRAYLIDESSDLRSTWRLHIEPQNRLGIRRAHIEPAIAQIDRQPVKSIPLSC